MTKKKKYIPWGRTLTTQDNYLGKSKTNSKKKRPVAVVDTNGLDLAVVPLSSKKGANRTELKKHNNKKTGQKTYYKHYLEIEDNEGKPIRVNDKFKENHKNMDLSKRDIDDIRKTIFVISKQKQRNNNIYNKFKNRYK